MLAKNRYTFQEGSQRKMKKSTIFLSMLTGANFALPLLAQELEIDTQESLELVCPLHQDAEREPLDVTEIEQVEITFIENEQPENEQTENNPVAELINTEDVKPTEQPEPIHPTLVPVPVSALVPAPVSNPEPTPTTDAAPVNAQAEQINEDNQSAQRILQHFAQVVAHFFSLVKDPKNPKVVQPNLNGMFSNMVSIFMEALKKNRNGVARRAPMPKEHANLAKKFNETVNQMVRKS